MEGEGGSGRRVVLYCLFLITIRFSNATESDVQCLTSIKESVNDPQSNLKSTWDFANITEGSICNFAGVECWHPNESKVLNLKLSAMGLEGNFPDGLQNCTSLTGLDLSDNNFSGPIPSDISTRVKSVTSLDLSSNRFTGEIPVQVANCTFLNVLKLQRNQLTGGIPAQLTLLDRLTTLDVSDNSLSGPLPNFKASIKLTVGGNADLCGSAPLPNCSGKINVGVIVGSITGAFFFAIVFFL